MLSKQWFIASMLKHVFHFKRDDVGLYSSVLFSDDGGDSSDEEAAVGLFLIRT